MQGKAAQIRRPGDLPVSTTSQLASRRIPWPLIVHENPIYSWVLPCTRNNAVVDSMVQRHRWAVSSDLRPFIHDSKPRDMATCPVRLFNVGEKHGSMHTSMSVITSTESLLTARHSRQNLFPFGRANAVSNPDPHNCLAAPSRLSGIECEDRRGISMLGNVQHLFPNNSQKSCSCTGRMERAS